MLTPEDRAIYQWQLDVPGFGEAGQEILRSSTALVSRVGGLGGPLAFALAAAGIGKLILAHAGNLKPSDLNRQILMRHGDLGSPRVESARRTLEAFNPGIEIETVAENFTEENAATLVERADIVFDCAPLFEERLLMNRESVAQNKILIDCAMYNLEGRVLSVVPGITPCLACIHPEVPPQWKRRFPVIGAVSALIGEIGALEGIKILTGLGEAHLGSMIYLDSTRMNLRKIALTRNPECPVCANV